MEGQNCSEGARGQKRDKRGKKMYLSRSFFSFVKNRYSTGAEKLAERPFSFTTRVADDTNWIVSRRNIVEDVTAIA